MLREKLMGDERFDLRSAEAATRGALLAVHAERYVDDFLSGTLDAKVMRRIGFPWSPELVKRTLASAGGTILAAETALETGFGGTLAGGTHHAFREEGAGFCVFNDLAVAIEGVRGAGRIKTAAVVDLDVHQGDGTAAIFEDNDEVFTLSVHGAQNFPFRKQKSSLDIALEDGTRDAEYLPVVERALARVWEFNPDMVFYQAGVDALATDRLGRLGLTQGGLGRRDRMVIAETERRGVPLVITIGGGYSEPIEQTVEAHAQTFRTAAEIYFEGGTGTGGLMESSPQPSSVPVP